jgi:two-component system, OmpR family, sensor histidine kinase KdpD
MTDAIKSTREKILVCLGSGPNSARLLYAASRIAADLQVSWIALTVESPPMLMLSEEERTGVADHLNLAEQLGAEAITLSGRNIADEIIRFAGERNITRIIVGKPRRCSLWQRIFPRNPVDRLIQESGNIDVYVITGTEEENKEPAYVVHPQKIPLSDYGAGFIFLAAATALCFVMYPFFSRSNLIMVYLLSVLLTAASCGRGPAIIVSLLSVLTFDFFFVPPRFSFTVEEAQDIVTFIVMLLVSLVISHLATQMRQQAETARLQGRQAAAMHGLSRQLAATRGIANILQVAVRYIAEIFDCQVAALLPDEAGKFKLHPAVGDLSAVIDKDIVKEMTIAQSAYETGEMAGWGTKTLPATDILYVPLHTANFTLGLLALRPAEPKRFLIPEQVNLLESLSKQVALALEVERLTINKEEDGSAPGFP